MNRNQTPDDLAWEVASDPSASEKNWMAACTLLEGKQLPGERKPHAILQLGVGLPWSLAVSGVSGLGAGIVFALTSSVLIFIMAQLSNMPVVAPDILCKGPHALAVIMATLIGFSTVFKYQQHTWRGGHVWSFVYYGLIAFFGLAAFNNIYHPFGIMTSQIIAPMLGLIILSTSVFSAKLTEKSIALLDKSVGSKRVMPHTRMILAVTGLLYLGSRVTGPFEICVAMIMCTWIFGTVLGTGIYITRLNKIHNPETATTMSLAVLSPIVLSSLLFVPTLLISNVVSMVSLMPICIPLYLSSLATLALVVLFPWFGAHAESKKLRKATELELHEMPAELTSLLPSPTNSSTENHSLCESV